MSENLDPIILSILTGNGHGLEVVSSNCGMANAEATLVDVIEQKLKTSALPLVLRKRLLYQKKMAEISSAQNNSIVWA